MPEIATSSAAPTSAPYLSHADLRTELGQFHRGQHRTLNTAFFGRGEEGVVEVAVRHENQLFNVVPVRSELDLRRALRRAETEHSPVALLVDDEARLPPDIAGRLAGGRLQYISRERRLANLFGVARVAPTLVEGPLAEVLLLAGWTFTPVRGATTIDPTTAWRSFLAKAIALPVDDTLTEDGVVEFFARQSPSSADPMVARLLSDVPGFALGIEDYFTTTVGPIAAIGWRNWRVGRGLDVAAMAFVLDALVPALDEGAVKVFLNLRLREFGWSEGGAKSTAVTSLVHRWAKLAAGLHLRLGEQAASVLRRADAILEEAGLREVVRDSRYLAAGLAGLKEELRTIITEALRRPKREGVPAVERDDVVKARRAWQRLDEHHLYRNDNHRAPSERVLMALRLLAYLSVRPNWGAELRDLGPTEPLLRLAEVFAREGGFVDLARARVRGGLREDPLDVAIAQVADAVDAYRDDMDRRFAKALALWNDDRRVGNVLPIENALSELAVSFLREGERRKLLVLLMDGMSWASAAELLLDLSAADYFPLRWQPPRAVPGAPIAMVAALPTMTEVSRAALFAGKLVTPGESLSTLRDPERLRENKAFVKVFGEGPTLLLRTEAESQTGHLTDSARKLVGSRDRVVALVLNAVDDHLTSKPGYHFRANRETIKALDPVLAAAREAGRAVLLIGDHGHVTSSRPHSTVSAKSSENPRYREADENEQPGDNEILLSGPNAYVARKGKRLAMLYQETDRYVSQRHAGEHGGGSLAEVVTPALMLATAELRQEVGEESEALDVVAYPIPGWWHLDVPVLKTATAETPKMPAKPNAKAKVSEAQLPLMPEAFEKPVHAEAPAPLSKWAARLSEVFAGLDKLRKLDLDKRVIPAVEILVEHGGRLAEDVFAGRLGEAIRNVGGRVALMAELLNEDGYQVIEHDVVGKQVRLDLDLLKELFGGHGK
jgi:hypothetical protein